jgi:hypothetical protein
MRRRSRHQSLGSACGAPGLIGNGLLSRRRVAFVAFPVVMVVALVGALLVFRGRPAATVASARSGPAAAAPVARVVKSADSATDPATLQLLQKQLDIAHAVAMRYPTLANALADGYTQAAPYAPGIGSHYMKYSLIYKDFDVAAPAMLLYNGDVPTSKIAGLAYYVYDSLGPPDGFAGPFDHWHQHQQTCVGPTGAHFDGNDDAIECRHRGRNAWMLHLWVVPGYQTPLAVFSDNCTILT